MPDTTRPIQLHRAGEIHGIEDAFESERATLLALLPAAEVLHTGGTSIPGAMTRGDLDIHVRAAPTDFDSARDELSRAYASYQRETWTDEFATFVRADAEIETGVAYNALKEAHAGAMDDDLYRAAKSAFFDRLAPAAESTF